MAGPFGAIGIAGTGVTVYRKWLDAVSDNIANINNAAPTSGEAFRARYVLAQAVDYGSGNGGVQVGGIELGKAEGGWSTSPTTPGRREGLRALPGHRPRRPDGAADDGAARLPGQHFSRRPRL
nr:hypothetical protein GCM10020093_119520 [Planobispora longispora]